MRGIKPLKFRPIDLSAGNPNRKRPVQTVFDDGRTCKFPDIHAAAKLMNIPASNITACLKGRLKTAGGYKWTYAEEE